MAILFVPNRQEAGIRRQGGGWWGFMLSSLLWWGVLSGTATGLAEEGRTWRYVSELSEEELCLIDLRTETPRDPTFPYLPAERYPFSPPYTAEEMGYRSMEFSHFARWSHALGTSFGSITPGGHLFNENNLDSFCYLPSEGLEGQLYETRPGEPYLKILSQGVFPPERDGNQSLFVLYRTDKEFVDDFPALNALLDFLFPQTIDLPVHLCHKFLDTGEKNL